MPGRPKLDLDPALALVLLARLDEPQPSLPAGEERRGDLLEVRGDCGERLVEAPVDGLGELVAERLELGQRRLEIGALRRELLETRLLVLVLLLRERVDPSQRLAPSFEPRGPLRERVAILGLVVLRLVRARRRPRRPRPGVCRASEASPSSRATSTSTTVTRSDASSAACRSSTSAAPRLAQLRAELGRAGGAAVDTGADRRLESRRGRRRAHERRAERVRGGDETAEQVDVESASPRRTLDERGVRGVSRVGGGARPSRCFVGVRERRRGSRGELDSVQAADADGLRRDAAEPGEDDFHVGGASARIRGVAACSCLEPRKPSATRSGARRNDAAPRRGER